MLRQLLITSVISLVSVFNFANSAVAMRSSKLLQAEYQKSSPGSEVFQNSNKKIIIAQAQGGINLGELAYDFTLVNRPSRVTVNLKDSFNRNNPTPAIQFYAKAKEYISLVSYIAYFYDSNGIEIGFVPVEIRPAGSIQPGQKVEVTIPLLVNQSQINKVVIKRS